MHHVLLMMWHICGACCCHFSTGIQLDQAIALMLGTPTPYAEINKRIVSIVVSRNACHHLGVILHHNLWKLLSVKTSLPFSRVLKCSWTLFFANKLVLLSHVTSYKVNLRSAIEPIFVYSFSIHSEWMLAMTIELRLAMFVLHNGNAFCSYISQSISCNQYSRRE